METRSTYTRLAFWLILVSCLAVGQGLNAQWSETVTFPFPDKEDGTTSTGSFVVTANALKSPSDPGKPIKDPMRVIFNGDSVGYVKLRLDNLKWDSESASSDDDVGSQYLLFVHSNWVDSDPAVYPDPKKKRKFIIAPNTEFTSSMSRPPSITFIVKKSGTYTFKIGYRVTTPYTKENKVTYHTFKFNIQGLNGVTSLPKTKDPDPVGPTVNNDNNVDDYNDQRLESLWLRAMKGKDPGKFLEFYRNSDDRERKDMVEKYLLTQFQINKQDNTFKIEYILPNLDGVRINPNLIRLDSIRAEAGNLAEDPSKRVVRDSLFMTLKDSATTHLIFATDPLGRPLAETIKLVPGADLFARVLEDKEETADLEIIGGTLPYEVTFFTNAAGKSDTLSLPKPVYSSLKTFNKAELATTLPVTVAGVYKVQVRDDNDYLKIANGTVFLTPPPRPPYAWMVIGALVLIAGGIVLWQWQKKKHENREMEVLLEQKKYEKTIRRKEKAVAGLVAAAEELNEQEAATVEEYKKIYVDLDALWRDSVTSTVVLTQDFQRSLEEFDKDQADTAVQDWFLPPGGFLLGEVAFSEETEAYELILNEVVSFQPLLANQEDLLFGEEGWQELRDMQREHYGTKVLGWMQVKPDGNMDLDPTGLRIHSTHFREPYQLVMVKSGTTGDIAFVSRKITGRMNNVKDTQEGADWFRLEPKS